MYNCHKGLAFTLVLLSALGCSEDSDDLVPVTGIEPRPIPGCEQESYLACNIGSIACQEAIFSATRCLRGNPGVAMPAVRTISRDEFGLELAADTLKPTLSPEQLAALEHGLVLIKLLKVGDLTGSGYVDSQKETVPGFYDPDTDTVTLIRQEDRGTIDMRTDDLLLVHEYVHALQDQEHDLNRDVDEYGATMDSTLASRSVVEGEASMHEDTFLAAVWGMDERELDREARYARQENAAATRLAEYSPMLRLPRSFPYHAGGVFVYRAFASGGMARVRELYAEPPTSTLEIRTGIRATPVLADPPAPPSGYDLLSVDTLGAELFFSFLQASLMNGEEATAFRNEWRGDRAYLYYKPGTTDVAVLWRIKLQNEAHRTQLRAAFPHTQVLEDDVLIIATDDADPTAVATSLFANVSSGNVVSPSTAKEDPVQAARLVFRPRLLPTRLTLR